MIYYVSDNIILYTGLSSTKAEEQGPVARDKISPSPPRITKTAALRSFAKRRFCLGVRQIPRNSRTLPPKNFSLPASESFV